VTNKKISFYIKDDNLTEVEKVNKRQNLIKDLSEDVSVGNFKKNDNSKFDDLFKINFPIERAGSNNCENMIGSVEIPVGLVGPVKVANLIRIAMDDAAATTKNIASDNISIENLFIPLATTEAALIASINRGCKALDLAENLSVVVKKVGMARSMVFKCKTTVEAYKFIDWIKNNKVIFIDYCQSTSKHLKFLSYQQFVRGRHVYLRFSFDTDEAMGMNMITIALKYAWDMIKKNHIGVKLISLSGNVCTDKKDSVLNRMFGRGFNVELEAFFSKEILNRIFHVDAKSVVESHIAKNLVGGNVAGSMAQNMHVANALSAFYIATGQDPAHVVGGSEASVTFEEEDEGLYTALTLPTVSVGSVGGGTWLPKQVQARNLIGMKNKIDSDSAILAVCAGIAALAGEVSGLCALTNNTLACAHQKLARNNKK